MKRNRHKCGHDREVCADAEREWFPQLTVCHADMAREAAEARFQRLHKDRPWHDGSLERWAEEPSAEFPYHFSHGTTVWVSLEDHGEGGDFLGG